MQQRDLYINGHSIELRVTAENPANNFLPDTGTLITYRRPQGNGIRVDDGYEESMEIPIFYDPLLAKLIVHAENRERACKKLIRAIEEFQISGVATTLPFGKFVMNHPAFLSGNFNTKFIEEHFSADKLIEYDDSEKVIAAALASKLANENYSRNEDEIPVTYQKSKWKLNRS